MFEVVYLAFTNRDFRVGGSGSFIGLTNFVQLFSDSRFYNDLGITLQWLLTTIIGGVALGLILASIVFEFTSGKFRSVCLLAFVIPAMLPSVAAAYMWKLMYSPSIGIISYLFSLVGVPGLALLSLPSVALYACALIQIWQWGCLLGALIVILLETVPRDAIEAARVFGAGGLTLYRTILFPIIAPGLTSLIFLNMIISLRSFDYIYVLTGGGPGLATETIDLYAYWEAIGSSGLVSYACCMSIIMLLITMVIMTVFWRVTHRS